MGHNVAGCHVHVLCTFKCIVVQFVSAMESTAEPTSNALTLRFCPCSGDPHRFPLFYEIQSDF